MVTREPTSIKASIVNVYKLQQTRHAIKTGIAAVIAILVYQYFNLPNGYWSVITAIVIMQSNMECGSVEGTLRVAMYRLIGTTVGCILGFSILLLFHLNQWSLLIVIFLILSMSSYFASLYQGFSLSGVTAVMVLLLSHQSPMTQSLALIRVVEILLGVLIAITVTVSIWPYRISDFLGQSRERRYKNIQELFIEVTHQGDSQHQTDEWDSKYLVLKRDIQGKEKYVSMVGKEDANREQVFLNAELNLLISIRHFAHSYRQMPAQYWDFSALKDITKVLVTLMASFFQKILERSPVVTILKDIDEVLVRHHMAFEEFRKHYRRLGESPFSIDDTYHIVNAYNAIRSCTDSAVSLGLLLRDVETNEVNTGD